ncbi:peptidoglycan-binding domain-containing protein [Streptomyces sp. NPDC058301]|uniref:peptidoglycan-binding domain-containing protein n=1 Tax=Streptomyces sp. NPDC058301 TaxID=3346436 RepID=UPI0036E62280
MNAVNGRRVSVALSAVALLVGSLLGATAAQAEPGVANIGTGSGNKAGIKCVQRAFNAYAGTKLAVDGVYGKNTKTAVGDFQRFWHLPVDGIVGPRTGGTIEFMVAQNNGGKDVWRSNGCWAVVPTTN